jgi:hypothetical protein
MMVIPFLVKAHDQSVRVEFVVKRGGWWCSVLVEQNGERGRSTIEGEEEVWKASGWRFPFIGGRERAQVVGKRWWNSQSYGGGEWQLRSLSDEDMSFMDTTTSSWNDTTTSFKYSNFVLMFFHQLFSEPIAT